MTFISKSRISVLEKAKDFQDYVNISLLHIQQEYTSAVSEKDLLFYL